MITRFSLLAILALQMATADEEICTPCINGEEFTLEPTFAFFRNASKTCATVLEEMNALAAAGTEANSTECKNGQLEAFQIGCCFNAPTEYCPICPDGSEHERLTVVPIDGTANDPSCEVSQFRKASLNALFITGDCSDTVLQRGAFYCGCPNTQQECSLCPDGAAPGNARKVDAYQSMSNCQGQAFLLSLFRADECENVRPNLGIDFAAFCECPGYEMPDDQEFVCNLCPEGQKVGNPDKVHTPDDAQFSRTCGQAEAFTEFITLPAICEFNMAEAREACCVDGAVGLMTSFSLMLSLGVMLVKIFL